MSASTQQELQDYVFREFGQVNSDAIQHFLRSAQTWIDQLCDFPYWFLVIAPDITMINQFPLSGSISSLTPLVGSWYKSGWLKTTAGTSLYPIYTPLEDGLLTDATKYYTPRIRSLQYMKQFDEQGCYMQDLQVLESDMASIGTSYGERGTPTQVEIRHTESGSFLHLYPTPEESCLYSVQYVIAKCPWYQVTISGSPQLKNRWLNYAPQAVIYKFLMEMAKFYHNEAMRDTYEKELKGESKSGGGYVFGSGKRGELGRLVEETRARARSLMNQMIQQAKPGAWGGDPFRPYRNRRYF